MSLEEALLGLGGDEDAELHDKEVSLTTSQITGSQTAIFEYDPQNEDPQGTPPGPWDGYSLFTIDLSGVKDDIEGMQAQIDAMRDCWEEVVAALQAYDPDYDPDEGECPADKVNEVVDKEKELEEEVEDLEEQLEDCHDCKDEVVAAIQKYVPNYQPDPDECPAPAIDDVYEKGKENGEYILPEGTDPNDPDFPKFTDGNPVTDKTTGVTIGMETYQNPDNSWGADGYSIINGEKKYYGIVQGGTAVPVDYFSDKICQVTDPSTGEYFFSITVHWGIPSWSPTTYTGTGIDQALIGYGDTSHTYSVKNS